MSADRHDHRDHDLEAMYSPEFWDERYAGTDALWSGRPNVQLVANVQDLAPGAALDLGCGEGADSEWLATQGWTVTAVDVSSVALNRAAERVASTAGAEVAARITWQQADLLSWKPDPDSFDLVSEQFLHLPSPIRERQHRSFAAAVRPGGTLLVVAHHPVDNEMMQRRHPPEMFFTAEEEAAALSPDEWEVTTGAPKREVDLPDLGRVTITDTVLRAVRRR